MIIKTIEAGVYDVNCCLIVDEKTKECAIIDPGGSEERIVDAVEELGAKPKYILLTHGHFDHVGAVEYISKKYNIPFYISKIDEEYMQNDNTVFGTVRKADGYLTEGDSLKVGDSTIRVIETPGHSEGGLSFLLNDDKLFAGDTLFRGSIGRTDFIGGDMSKLINSIKTKLLPLGDKVDVYPGHGDITTIGFERMNNPFL